MNFGEILTRAWQIIWKHRVLWIFGILAGCANGSGGAGNSGTSFRGDAGNQIQNFWYYQMQDIPDWQIALFVAVVLLVVVILVILAIFLGTVGRIGLVRGTMLAEQGEESLQFGELFQGSLPYFWRVFLLNVLVGLAILVIGAAFAAVALAGTVLTLGLLALCLLPLACLLVPLMWFVGIIVEQSSIAIVVENLGIMEGLNRGWDIVKTHLGNVLIMGLILVMLGVVAGALLGIPFVVIVLPAVIGVAMNGSGAIGGGILIAGLCLITYLPVFLVLNGILRGYIESAWTLTFLRLTGNPASAAPVEA